MKIDKNVATISRMIKSGNPAEVFSISGLPDISNTEIYQELKKKSRDSVRNAERVLRGYFAIEDKNLRRGIVSLVAIELELRTQDKEFSAKIKRFLDNTVSFDFVKRIKQLLIKLCQGSEAIRRSLDDLNINFLVLIKNILREVRHDKYDSYADRG